ICVVGPTATGKTRLAVAVAARLDAAVISADSRQVYRGMDIGTGKDLAEYMLDGKEIPHYLIDILEAGYEYNVFEYQRDFFKVYHALQQQGKPCVLCGGSGMYVESILKNYALHEVPTNMAMREAYADKSMEELTEILKSYIHLHNNSDTETRERLLRALEIQIYYREHGITQQRQLLPHIAFYMAFPRPVLRERISLRLRERLQQGMVEEVQALMDKGLTKSQLMYYGLEYKYITMYLTHDCSYGEMVSKLETAIHQFAKRQETWFRHMERNGFHFHRIDGLLPMEEKLSQVFAVVQRELPCLSLK
ncbi:MAG: tRNA (adenosine(37)-N6)-dimethylallyltransferase MiaA, partial [Bacteroidales bacterium]|nr:tRNA (adenosine(37)-N6)-dimethylallyltransferase MiaA [Bacteroidales bacterium]